MKLKITVALNKVYNSTGPSNSRISIWDGTPGSGTQIAQGEHTSGAANYGSQVSMSVIVTPSAGNHTYNVATQNVGGTTVFIDATVTSPATLIIERVG